MSAIRSLEPSYLPLLDFLRMNTKTADQPHTFADKTPLVLFDTSAAATVSVRMLKQGLDHCSVHLVSMKMNDLFLVKSLCTVPESSCFTGYSVMWFKGAQDTSSQRKEMFLQVPLDSRLSPPSCVPTLALVVAAREGAQVQISSQARSGHDFAD